VSSTSDGSERAVATEGDLAADADSMACRQSDMPANNDNAGSKVVPQSIPYLLTYFIAYSCLFPCILQMKWCFFLLFVEKLVLILCDVQKIIYVKH